ncbi:DUF3224 domain-containing protein [Herbihabitans rhizosphaerae]|nr:DUF3224 domain-containing protein [Herbihabitans rhizosphaerae]
MTIATGTFDLHDWEQEVAEEGPGSQVGRVTNRKTFHGDIEGSTTCTLLTVAVPDASGEFQGTAYVGVERITGSVHGRRGSFTVTHLANLATGMSVSVVAGSATDELAGLTGELSITRHDDGSHTYSFDYDLE